MMALISIRKGRSLKTTFSILPCQLASGYVLHRRFRMGNWTLRRKKNLFLQYLEVPLAVRAAANDDSLSNRCDGSRACSRSIHIHGSCRVKRKQCQIGQRRAVVSSQLCPLFLSPLGASVSSTENGHNPGQIVKKS